MKRLHVPDPADFVAAATGGLLAAFVACCTSSVILEVVWSPLFRVASAVLLLVAGVLTAQRRRGSCCAFALAPWPWERRRQQSSALEEDASSLDADEHLRLPRGAAGGGGRCCEAFAWTALAALEVAGAASALVLGALLREDSSFCLRLCALCVLATALALFLLSALADLRLLLGVGGGDAWKSGLAFEGLVLSPEPPTNAASLAARAAAASAAAAVGVLVGASAALKARRGEGEALRLLALVKHRLAPLPLAVFAGALAGAFVGRLRRNAAALPLGCCC